MMGSVADELRRVGTGLRLVFLGLMAVVACLAAFAVIVATLGELRNDPKAILFALGRDHPTAWTVVLGLNVLASVLILAGRVYCLSAPSAVQAQGFILIAVACAGLGLLAYVLSQSSEAGDEEAAGELMLLSLTTSLIGYLFFLRFLSRLAVFLGAERLRRRVRRVQLGTAGLSMAALLIMVAAAAGATRASSLLARPLLFLAVPILYGTYTWLVFDLRRATEAAAASMAEGEPA